MAGSNSTRQLLIDVKLDSADAANNLKDLKSSIKELQNEAIRVGEGGKGFNELISKAGELQDKINDVRGTTQALAGNVAENLTNSFSKVASAGIGAFQAIAGAQAVFGKGSEDLQKTLVKLQGLLALSQGIKEIANIGQAFKDFKTVITDVIAKVIAFAVAQEAAAVATESEVVATESATVAQEGLNAAMLANPIIAVLAGIVALVSAISAFNGVAEDAAKKQAELNNEQAESKKRLEDMILEYESLNTEIGINSKELNENQAAQQKNSTEGKKQLSNLLEEVRKKRQEIINSDKDELDSAEEKNKALNKLNSKFADDAAKIQQNYFLNKINNDVIAFQKAIELERKALSMLNELRAGYQADRELSDLATAKESHRQSIENINIEYKDSVNRNALLSAEQVSYEKIKTDIQEKYAKERAEKDKAFRLKLSEEIRAEGLKLLVDKETDDEKLANGLQKMQADDANLKYNDAIAARNFLNKELLESDKISNQEKKAILTKQYNEDLEAAKKQGRAVGEATKLLTVQYQSDLKKLDTEYFKSIDEKIQKFLAKYGQTISSSLAAVATQLSAIQALVAQNASQEIQRLDKENQVKQEALQSELDNNLVAIEDNKTKEEEFLYNSNQAQLADSSLTADQKNAINQQYALQKYNLDKKTALDEYSIKKQAADVDYKTKLASFTEGEKIKKAAFESDKKFRMASAIISGAQAVLSALATPPFPLGLALAIAASITTAIQVATISKQQYNAGTAPAPPPPIAMPSFSAPPGGSDSSSDSKTSPSDIALFGTAGRRNKLGSSDDEGNRSINVNVNLDVNEVTRKQTSVANFEKSSTLGH